MSRLHQTVIWNSCEGAFHSWKYEVQRGTQLVRDRMSICLHLAELAVGLCVYW